MLQFVVELAEKFKNEVQGRGAPQEVYTTRDALAEELERLDPRDFVPAARRSVAMVRKNFSRMVKANKQVATHSAEYIAYADQVIQLIPMFNDAGQTQVRSLAFVVDANLRKIIERDYRELRIKVFPSGAWKSSVVLAGSILEGLLFDKLTADPVLKSKVLAWPSAPKDRTGRVEDIDAGDWKLIHLINAAEAFGVLSTERVKAIDQVLRDYRNFVHPKKEIKSKHECTEAEAFMSIGALEGVINTLNP